MKRVDGTSDVRCEAAGRIGPVFGRRCVCVLERKTVVVARRRKRTGWQERRVKRSAVAKQRDAEGQRRLDRDGAERERESTERKAHVTWD